MCIAVKTRTRNRFLESIAAKARLWGQLCGRRQPGNHIAVDQN